MTDLIKDSKTEQNDKAAESSSEDQDDQFSLSSDEPDECKSNGTGPPMRRQTSIQSLRFRAQKHLVGRVVNSRQSIKPLIGKKAYTALKQFEHLLKLHLKPASDAKRLIRSVVKTIGKLGVVAKQHNLTDEQIVLAHEAKQQFYKIALTCINFVKMDYTYNQIYLSQLLLQCQQTLCRCVNDTLSSKSVDRLTYIFRTLSDPTLMDNVFSLTATQEQRNALIQLTSSLETMVAKRRH